MATPVKSFLSFAVFLLLGACSSQQDLVRLEDTLESVEAVEVVLPVEGYFERATYKVFGEYYSDRFVGWHSGDDVEFVDTVEEVPVVAIADGTVTRVGTVGGYGGFMSILHTVDGREIHAIYGHIDLSSTSLSVGDAVTRGQFLANLGEGYSSETDGERKHLHFGLYEGSDLRVNGYESSEAGLSKWINPSEFFVSLGLGD